MSNFIEMEFFDKQPGNTPFVCCFPSSTLSSILFRLRRSTTKNMFALLGADNAVQKKVVFAAKNQPHAHSSCSVSAWWFWRVKSFYGDQPPDKEPSYAQTLHPALDQEYLTWKKKQVQGGKTSENISKHIYIYICFSQIVTAPYWNININISIIYKYSIYTYTVCNYHR